MLLYLISLVLQLCFLLIFWMFNNTYYKQSDPITSSVCVCVPPKIAVATPCIKL